MTTTRSIQCTCGKVKGTVQDVDPDTTTRAICYCADCQAFAQFLGRAELLDAHGGSDIVQVAPATMQVTEGADQLRCMRLSDKGLFRWFADCCKTPFGNALSPRIPFIGLATACFDDGKGPGARDQQLGPVRGYIYPKYAIDGVPAEVKRAGQFAIIGRSMRTILRWKLTGKSKPHPYFDGAGKPVREPRVLTPAERDALRPAVAHA